MPQHGEEFVLRPVGRLGVVRQLREPPALLLGLEPGEALAGQGCRAEFIFVRASCELPAAAGHLLDERNVVRLPRARDRRGDHETAFELARLEDGGHDEATHRRRVVSHAFLRRQPRIRAHIAHDDRLARTQDAHERVADGLHRAAIRDRRRPGGVATRDEPGAVGVDGDESAAIGIEMDSEEASGRRQRVTRLRETARRVVEVDEQPIAFARGGQRRLRLLPLRDVDPQPVQPLRRPVVAVRGTPAAVHPAEATLHVAKPELDDVVAARPDGVADGRLHVRKVVGMDEREEVRLPAGERAGLQTEDLLQFAAPPHDVGSEIARPRAHAPGAHRQCQDVAALAQRVLFAPPQLVGAPPLFGDVDEQHRHAVGRGIESILEATRAIVEPDVAHGAPARGDRFGEVRTQDRQRARGQDVVDRLSDGLRPCATDETCGGVIQVDEPQVRVDDHEALVDCREDPIEHAAACLSYGTRVRGVPCGT